jgi:hypothetical protein
MPVLSQAVPESDRPSLTALADARCTALVERVLAVAHLCPSAHVVIIGRRTLPLVLALMKRGCDAVRSLRPGAPRAWCWRRSIGPP